MIYGKFNQKIWLTFSITLFALFHFHIHIKRTAFFYRISVIGEKDHKIPEFSFINQDSVIVTNSDLGQYIYRKFYLHNMSNNLSYYDNKYAIYSK